VTSVSGVRGFGCRGWERAGRDGRSRGTDLWVKGFKGISVGLGGRA
jgi:hypothetical protein